MASQWVPAGWRLSLPLLLPLLLLLPPAVHACMDTVLQNGTMVDSELVVPEMQVAGSCACCGLCHHHPSCASLSFSSTSGACRLYGSVPDFSRLTVDGESQLYVRPGRSEHHQFCRRHSDCQQPGDRCSGRVCTTDVTLTCRDLAETHNAPMADTYYGSFNGTLMKYHCISHSGIDGWTMISHATHGGRGWSRSNIRERNKDDPSNSDYSILGLSDELSLSGSEPRFQVLVIFSKGGNEVGFVGSLPVEQTLLSAVEHHRLQLRGRPLQMVTDFGNYAANGNPVKLPWLPPTGAALLSLNPAQGIRYYYTLINTANTPYLSYHHTVAQYFVRE